MELKTLSPDTMSTINDYMHLPFSAAAVPCTYFNNRRSKARGALRVLIGKGTPKEIVEEAKMFALRERRDIDSFSSEQLQQFLVEHNLGVDCSGLVYHLLDQELVARKKKTLKQALRFSHLHNPLRRILAKLRSVENTDVTTLAHNDNSHIVELAQISPGDIITVMASKKFGNPNHVLLVHEVEYVNNAPTLVRYTHSFQWPSDGKFAHGIRQGEIAITDINKPLTEQSWIEQGESGEKNHTYKIAKEAERVELRRLRALA